MCFKMARTCLLLPLIAVTFAVGTAAAEQPPEIVYELMSARVGDFEVFLFTLTAGKETHFYGGVFNKKQVPTLVFLGSVGRQQLISGGLAPSTTAGDALLSWWTDGHCHYVANTLTDSRDVVLRNMSQLIGEDQDELLVGLRGLTTADNPHPVILRNMVPFFADLIPVATGEQKAAIILADDERLLRLLWDQIEIRYWQAVVELKATDKALLELEVLERDPREKGAD
ncbi:MAG: hypothetical protein ACC742_09515 [Thermoanaerobaculales bacterium]